MKRWALILSISMIFIGGAGAGIAASYAIWNIAYAVGGINANAEHMLETQYFKDMVQDGRQFRLGDYLFKADHRHRRTVRVWHAPKNGTAATAVGGKE